MKNLKRYGTETQKINNSTGHDKYEMQFISNWADSNNKYKSQKDITNQQ